MLTDDELRLREKGKRERRRGDYRGDDERVIGMREAVRTSSTSTRM